MALDLVLQLSGVFLHGEQGVLALLVLRDAVLQLLKTLGQPRFAPGWQLRLPLRVVRVLFKAGREGLLIVYQLLMLQAQFAQLGIQTADVVAQLIKVFLSASTASRALASSSSS